MRKFQLLFFVLLFAFVGCNKDDDDDDNSSSSNNNNSNNVQLPDSDLYIQYNDVDGNQVVVRGSNVALQEPYVVNATGSENSGSYTFSSVFLNMNNSQDNYTIMLTNFSEAGWSGTDIEAGNYFLKEGTMDYTDPLNANANVQVMYGLNEFSSLGTNENSNFEITDVEYNESPISPRWTITGEFDCILYDSQGAETRRMTDGYFKVMVGI